MPTRALQAHADAVFAAAWTERDRHDAIPTACLVDFMNRLLEGHGVKLDPGVFAERGRALHGAGFAPLLAMLAPAPSGMTPKS